MRTVISALFTLLLSNIVNSQPGALVKNFGVGGKVTSGFGSPEDIGRKAAIQADGKIVQTGTAYGLGIAVARYNADGTLDNSFGGDGKVTTSIRGYDDEGQDIAIQKDGKIVVAGVSYNTDDADFAIVRYNPNGALDKTFSGDGKVTTPIGTYHDVCLAVVIQPDGKILAAGYSYQGQYQDFALLRYNTDGTLDKSFGNGGKVTTDIGGFDDVALSIALQSDGKILLGGNSNYDFALVRYNSNGSLDKSFDADGKATTDMGDYASLYSIAIQQNSKIVVAGVAVVAEVSDADFALARYNTNGSLDKSFGGNGKVITPVGSGFDQAFSVAIQPNGQIVVGGIAFTDFGGDDFALVRYNPDGSLDSSLDYDGKVTTDFSYSNDKVSSVIFTPKGKIVVAGSTYITSEIFAVAEYNSYWDVRSTTGLYDETSSGCYNWPQSYPQWTDFVEHDATNTNYYLGMQTQSKDPFGKICGYQSLVYAGNDLRENYTWDGSTTKKLVGYLRRNFKFTFTNNNLSNPAGIRLYITTQELKKFITKFNNCYGTSYSLNDIYVIRYDGINQDTDLKNNSNNKNDYKKIIPTLTYYGFNNEYASLEFHTNHFSEFQIALSTTNLLLMQQNLIAGVKESDALSNTARDVLVYPNPANNVLHIQTNGNTIISLTDQSGKIILTKTIEGSGVINIAALPAGLYYLKNNATGETQKIIITK